METNSEENLLDSIPPGLTLASSDGQALVVHHKRTGMGCMNAFLVFWLSSWTVVCIYILYHLLSGGKMEGGEPMPLWFAAVFWVFEIAIALLLTYLFFCRKVFRIDQDSLTVNTEVLAYKRSQFIPRESIQRLIQVQDGGTDDDSFPSWGLKIEAEKDTTLIYRQPYEVSHWLGQFLAQWAGVEFVEVEKEKEES